MKISLFNYIQYAAKVSLFICLYKLDLDRLFCFRILSTLLHMYLSIDMPDIHLVLDLYLRIVPA